MLRDFYYINYVCHISSCPERTSSIWYWVINANLNYTIINFEPIWNWLVTFLFKTFPYRDPMLIIWPRLSLQEVKLRTVVVGCTEQLLINEDSKKTRKPYRNLGNNLSQVALISWFCNSWYIYQIKQCILNTHVPATLILSN